MTRRQMFLLWPIASTTSDPLIENKSDDFDIDINNDNNNDNGMYCSSHAEGYKHVFYDSSEGHIRT